MRNIHIFRHLNAVSLYTKIKEFFLRSYLFTTVPGIFNILKLKEFKNSYVKFQFQFLKLFSSDIPLFQYCSCFISISKISYWIKMWKTLRLKRDSNLIDVNRSFKFYTTYILSHSKTIGLCLIYYTYYILRFYHSKWFSFFSYKNEPLRMYLKYILFILVTSNS